jgi:hypothetical protein
VKNGRASDVPATKLDLSKPLFPAEPDDQFAEYGVSAKVDGRIDFADVKAATLRSLDFIIPRLLPGGKRVGDEWVVRNPTRNDSKPGSFSVNMRTGVWSDFATGERGGDMIDLYVYVTGGSNVQAKDALADILNLQAGSGSTGKTSPLPPKRSAASTAAPDDYREPPNAFPARTLPDKDGKPRYEIAGEGGPPVRSNELRRHVFHRGGVPVRIKIIKKDKKGALNVYRVTGADGVTGWQYAKPKGFQQTPYFIAGSDPFTAFINQRIFWTEGEKDVETMAGLGGLAFTFGGTGDGLPDGCHQYMVGRHVVILADNDEPGRKHADEKAAIAAKVSASIKVIHFPELADKGDVSDWIEAGKTFDDLKALVDATENWKPAQNTSNPNEIEIFWHGNSYNRVARPALVKELIPESGVGLASGQWGAGKTFAVIDLAASVMTGTPFAGREVCRRGGVLFIAAEGASEIPIRLEGVVNYKLRPNFPIPGLADVDNLPFAWIEECPSLKEDASFERLIKIVLAAAKEMKDRFSVDLALIIIDTLSASGPLPLQCDG